MYHTDVACIPRAHTIMTLQQQPFIHPRHPAPNPPPEKIYGHLNIDLVLLDVHENPALRQTLRGSRALFRALYDAHET